jgi:hypothetical protein
MSMTRMEIIVAIGDIRYELWNHLQDPTYDRQKLAEETVERLNELDDRA